MGLGDPWRRTKLTLIGGGLLAAIGAALAAPYFPTARK